MNFIISAIKKDLVRRMREPWVIAFWLAIPLMLGVMLTIMTGGDDGTTPTAHLLIADRDESTVSGFVSGFFSQGELAELINTESVTLEEGRTRIDAGEASALLVIPEGFGDAVLTSTESTLLLWVNPSQRVLPAIIEESLSILVDGVFYVQTVFGDEVQTILGSLEAEADELADITVEDVGEIAEGIAVKIDDLSDYLLPPLIEVETAVEQESSVDINLSLLFFPGILLMALMWTTQGLSDELWREREMGTLKRLASSPNSLTTFLAGKLFYGLIIMAAIFVFMMALGFAYHQLDLLKFPYMLLLMLLAGVDFMLLFSLIAILVPTRRAAGLIGTLLVLPLMMLGGSFFPFEAMPSWMVSIGQWTPNGLVLNQLKDYLFDNSNAASMMLTVASLIVIGIALFAVSAWRNREFAKA